MKEVNEELGVFVDIGTSKDMLLGKEDLPLKKSVLRKPDDLLYITLRVTRKGRIYVKLAGDPVFEEKMLQSRPERV